jgi:hypothetical protein
MTIHNSVKLLQKTTKLLRRRPIFASHITYFLGSVTKLMDDDQDKKPRVPPAVSFFVSVRLRCSAECHTFLTTSHGGTSRHGRGFSKSRIGQKNLISRGKNI